MQSSGQRHTPSATHSARFSSSGWAQPLFTSNHVYVLRSASATVEITRVRGSCAQRQRELRGRATVDRERVPGDVRREIGAEERDRARDVVGGGEPAEGN